MEKKIAIIILIVIVIIINGVAITCFQESKVKIYSLDCSHVVLIGENG